MTRPDFLFGIDHERVGTFRAVAGEWTLAAQGVRIDAAQLHAVITNSFLQWVQRWPSGALARALGTAHQVDPPALPETSPRDIEPWVETVLFGSSADVRALLDRKFDPNAATNSGATTALMLAMPDLEKAKLLLDRGANVNTRSKTKFSALLVAANYPAATPTMRLLLEHGAEMRLPKGEGAPMFNSFPLILAAMAGNPEALPLLRRAGDDVNGQMNVIGMIPLTAMFATVPYGDSAVIRALLDAGAPVDQTDEGGMTFGDSGMIDLLLKAGANPSVRTKEGATPLDLANKYRHTHLVSSLMHGTI